MSGKIKLEACFCGEVPRIVMKPIGKRWRGTIVCPCGVSMVLRSLFKSKIVGRAFVIMVWNRHQEMFQS